MVKRWAVLKLGTSNSSSPAGGKRRERRREREDVKEERRAATGPDIYRRALLDVITFALGLESLWYQMD